MIKPPLSKKPPQIKTHQVGPNKHHQRGQRISVFLIFYKIEKGPLQLWLKGPEEEPPFLFFLFHLIRPYNDYSPS